MKTLITMALAALTLVGCGKTNNSGSSSAAGSPATLPGVYGNLDPNFMNIIRTENRCAATGAQDRVISTQPLSFNRGGVINGVYIGVTSYGDIAVVNYNTTGATITIEACPRYTYQGQAPAAATAQIYQQSLVLQSNPYCSFGDVIVDGVINNLPVAFRSVAIPQANIMSQACTQAHY